MQRIALISLGNVLSRDQGGSCRELELTLPNFVVFSGENRGRTPTGFLADCPCYAAVTAIIMTAESSLPSLTSLTRPDRQISAIDKDTLFARYQQAIEIHEWIEELLGLIETGIYSMPVLAEEVGVSIPTISRIVTTLRKLGHDIRAEWHGSEWCYVISQFTAAHGNSRTIDRDSQNKRAAKV
jgi:hypothetical protein